jgi:hypothetical protein
MIIIDDAAVSANVWCKYQEIKELFFNGRHHKLTFMISFQDDKLLESSLRKNSFINIFTTEIVCNSFFERRANNFRKDEKDKLAKLAKCIFNDENKKNKSHKKLIYLKDESPSVYYIIADNCGEFYFGSKHLHDLCKKIKKKEDDDDWDDFKNFF